MSVVRACSPINMCHKEAAALQRGHKRVAQCQRRGGARQSQSME